MSLIDKIFFNNPIQQGYEKSNISHKEGDVWEEDKKTWTIKNGIKQTISKLDDFNSKIFVPILCPICNNTMKKRLDPKFYNLFNMCMDCKIKEDTNLQISGNFTKYETEMVNKNKIGWVTDLEHQLNDMIDKHDSEYIFNEFGDTERLDKNMTKEELKELFNKQLTEIREKLKLSE